MSARDELLEALRRELEGEVSADGPVLDLYSDAACIYRVRPRAVAWPRHPGDVEALLSVCRRAGVPVTARGAGSGVAGQTLGEGVIADFSRHLTGLPALPEGPPPAQPGARAEASARVRVEPGVPLGGLNRALAPLGWHFSPDPSSGAYCTIGGMIANNAGGAHSVRYGSTRRHLLSVSAVTGRGERLVTSPLPAGFAAGPAGDANRRLAAGLKTLLSGREEIVERHTPRVSRNSSGYDLRGATEDGGVDLGRLIAGSEGTLALVTEATLRVLPVPAARGTALALFDDLRRAGEGIVEALAERPSCLELMSETLIRMVREESPAVRAAVPASTRALVIIECDGATAEEAAGALERVRRRLTAGRPLASSFEAVLEPEKREQIWSVRRVASPILTAKEGRRRNVRFIEDACVPPERLVEFLEGLRAIFAREKLEAAIFGHAGDSLVHVNPLMDPAEGSLRERMEAIAAEFTDLVAGLGGTLSGEHGDGRLRTPFLKRACGPLADLFGEVKALFDPERLLNPGIIVGDGRRRMTDDLREGPTRWQAPAPAAAERAE